MKLSTMDTSDDIDTTKILIFSATRGKKEDTALYQSSSAFAEHSHTSLIFAEHNRLGLPMVYNQIMHTVGHSYDIIAFVHDDVSIQDSMVRRKLIAAHRKYDIVGLAGGDLAKFKDHKVPPLWHMMSEKRSGIVAHPTEADGSITSICFGPTPHSVSVIDGLFISVKMDHERDPLFIKFNEQFDFHFYDIAFCLDAITKGVTIGTWPIWVVHNGLGDSFRSKAWDENRQTFNMYYRP